MRKAIDLLVIRNWKILLVRKNQTWILPGGKPEENEGDLECLQREIKEELGVEPIVENFYGSFVGQTPHRGDLLQAKIYFGRLRPCDKLVLRKEDSISEVRFLFNPCDYNMSDITKKVVDSLIKEGYLKRVI